MELVVFEVVRFIGGKVYLDKYYYDFKVFFFKVFYNDLVIIEKI